MATVREEPGKSQKAWQTDQGKGTAHGRGEGGGKDQSERHREDAGAPCCPRGAMGIASHHMCTHTTHRHHTHDTHNTTHTTHNRHTTCTTHDRHTTHPADRYAHSIHMTDTHDT